MKIIIDAFGGDHAPNEIIKGAVKAINENKGFSLILTGNQEIIEKELSKYTFEKDRIEIINCLEIITNEDVPTVAIRSKKDSSLVVALNELKANDEIVGLVSAGSTGAVLTGATLKIGRIPNITRPALCPILPTITNRKVALLDCGANVDCKPINLVHFAIMGSSYMQSVYGVEKPRVALLSNGTEDKKGNELVKESFKLLKELGSINFVGNMEARDILSGEYDVIVTDGFAGNVALKGLEGSVLTVLKLIKQGIMKSFVAKIGALFLKKTFKELKNKLDYNKQGGALFIGAKKIIIKSHGSSKFESIAASIMQVKDMADSNLVLSITEKLEKMNLTIETENE